MTPTTTAAEMSGHNSSMPNGASCRQGHWHEHMIYLRVSLASQIADLADNGKNVIATEISPSKHGSLASSLHSEV